MSVLALSVDILFGDEGDLTQTETLGKWRQWCRAGAVVAVVAV